MTRSYKVTIEYDGTRYHGWQVQNDVPTIQAEMEKALLLIAGQHSRVTASGRTDTGVHAIGQVAGFTIKKSISVGKLHNGLNALLPEDIVIRNLVVAPDGFHPRYDAVSKVYQYRILNRLLPDAIGRFYSWHIKRRLDFTAMQQAADHLIGTHDFTSFEGAGSPRATSVRHVMEASFTCNEDEHSITFQIEADGFLRFMVRNIVGTLVEVGFGKRETHSLKDILLARDRSVAGPTAPPQGLFLIRVNY